MGNKVTFPYTVSGVDAYFHARLDDGTIWDTVSEDLVAYTSANYANYKITLTEQGAARSSKVYVGQMPAAPAGEYVLVAFSQATVSGTPHEINDDVIGIGYGSWDGDEWIPRLGPMTAGRRFAVSSGGGGSMDFANIEHPSATVNLSGTTIKTATDVETDTANIQTRLPAALTAGGNMKSDMLAINNDTTAAANAEKFFEGAFITGSVDDATPSTTEFNGDSSLSSTANFYNGCTLVFTSGTLKGITRKISDYSGSTTKTFTFSGLDGRPDAAWPSTPADLATFIIIGRIG